jgi:clan AA aspartic protease (TIGR02281 family)
MNAFFSSVHSETYIKYADDPTNNFSEWYDLDSIKLVSPNDNLVILNTKFVFKNTLPSGAKFAIKSSVLDCSRQYQKEIKRIDYTYDNVPLNVTEKASEEAVIQEALDWLKHKDLKSYLYGYEKICLDVSRWVHANHQNPDVKFVTNDSLKSRTSLPLIKEGGVYIVKAKINDLLVLKFVVDSGASDIVIPDYIAKTLFASDVLSKSDIIGNSSYQMANGAIEKGSIVNIQKFSIGEHTLYNVRGAIIKSDSSTLLMGQSVLRRLGKWRINVENSKFEIE